MAWLALRRSCEIPYVSDDGFVALVNDYLLKEGSSYTAEMAFPLGYRFKTHPAALLHQLGLATAASIPHKRHWASSHWAFARYVDLFARSRRTGNELKLDRWVAHTERNHRKAVLSEDMGIAICAIVASRKDPARTLMDVDAYESTHNGRVWKHANKRPDYITAIPNATGSSVDRGFNVWEAKGRSHSSERSIAKTFAKAVLQTCSLTALPGWQLEGRFVVGSLVKDLNLGFHALKVVDPQKAGAGTQLHDGPEGEWPPEPDDEQRTTSDSRQRAGAQSGSTPVPWGAPSLTSLLRFAGLSTINDGIPDPTEFEIRGRRYRGRSISVPVEGQVITVIPGVASEVLENARAGQVDDWHRSMIARVASEPDLRNQAGYPIRVEVSDRRVTTVHPNGTSLQISV